ncbi:MAG: FkbM family methyltransferase [Saprospiraceae bacterium]|nr:FkbM family methyltransferase [Saprospiraceae bacterium]
MFYLAADFEKLCDLKALIKQLLKALPIAFTKNQQYDRLTKRVIRRVCKSDSNCIDVGCHKGEILDLFLAAAPQGQHVGFEPIPNLFENLRKKYAAHSNCQFYDVALSNQKGSSSFNYVVSNPSYSGLMKRRYDRANEQDTLITVQTERLDDLLPMDARVDLIKIDVEGGERLVMEGAVEILRRWKPVVIFEHGLGASDMYGSTPELLYDLLNGCGLQVSLLDRFLNNQPPLSREAFSQNYYERLNYYFIAYNPTVFSK